MSNESTFDLSLKISQCSSTTVGGTLLLEDNWRLLQSSYGLTVLSNGTIFVKISHENLTQTMCDSDEFLSCMKTATGAGRRFNLLRHIQV